MALGLASSVSCARAQSFESKSQQKRLGLTLQSKLSALLSETVNASAKTTNPMGGTPTSAAMQVHHKDKLLAEVYLGHSDAEGHVPLDTTIFRIGSNTKLFPVLMLYQLYERGIVRSLDDPISDYEPSFSAINLYSNSKQKFTLRQLASQLSGLPRGAPCQAVTTDCNVSTDEILKRWNATPGAIHPEDTQPSYSNFAYALLGNVLAGTVGMSFEEYVQQEILKPLDMVDTGFVYSETILKRMAKAYSNESEIPMYDMGWVAPAGQMYSTVRDMSRLCSFYLGSTGNVILDESLRRQLMLPGFVLQGGHSLIGAPWEIQMLEDGWPLVGKTGNVPGYSAYTGLVPALNVSIVVMWSGAAGQDTFSLPAKVLNMMLPELPLWELPPGIPNHPSTYLGSYRADVPFFGHIAYSICNASLPDKSWGLTLVSSADNGTMWLDFKDDSIARMTKREAVREESLVEMLMALDNEWLVFKLEPNGVVSFTLPGLYYGSTFERAYI